MVLIRSAYVALVVVSAAVSGNLFASICFPLLIIALSRNWTIPNFTIIIAIIVSALQTMFGIVVLALNSKQQLGVDYNNPKDFTLSLIAVAGMPLIKGVPAAVGATIASGVLTLFGIIFKSIITQDAAVRVKQPLKLIWVGLCIVACFIAAFSAPSLVVNGTFFLFAVVQSLIMCFNVSDEVYGTFNSVLIIFGSLVMLGLCIFQNPFIRTIVSPPDWLGVPVWLTLGEVSLVKTWAQAYAIIAVSLIGARIRAVTLPAPAAVKHHNNNNTTNEPTSTNEESKSPEIVGSRKEGGKRRKAVGNDVEDSGPGRAEMSEVKVLENGNQNANEKKKFEEEEEEDEEEEQDDESTVDGEPKNPADVEQALQANPLFIILRKILAIIYQIFLVIRYVLFVLPTVSFIINCVVVIKLPSILPIVGIYVNITSLLTSPTYVTFATTTVLLSYTVLFCIQVAIGSIATQAAVVSSPVPDWIQQSFFMSSTGGDIQVEMFANAICFLFLCFGVRERLLSIMSIVTEPPKPALTPNEAHTVLGPRRFEDISNFVDHVMSHSPDVDPGPIKAYVVAQAAVFADKPVQAMIMWGRIVIANYNYFISIFVCFLAGTYVDELDIIHAAMIFIVLFFAAMPMRLSRSLWGIFVGYIFLMTSAILVSSFLNRFSIYSGSDKFGGVLSYSIIGISPKRQEGETATALIALFVTSAQVFVGYNDEFRPNEYIVAETFMLHEWNRFSTHLMVRTWRTRITFFIAGIVLLGIPLISKLNVLALILLLLFFTVSMITAYGAPPMAHLVFWRLTLAYTGLVVLWVIIYQFKPIYDLVDDSFYQSFPVCKYNNITNPTCLQQIGAVRGDSIVFATILPWAVALVVSVIHGDEISSNIDASEKAEADIKAKADAERGADSPAHEGDGASPGSTTNKNNNSNATSPQRKSGGFGGSQSFLQGQSLQEDGEEAELDDFFGGNDDGDENEEDEDFDDDDEDSGDDEDYFGHDPQGQTRTFGGGGDNNNSRRKRNRRNNNKKRRQENSDDEDEMDIEEDEEDDDHDGGDDMEQAEAALNATSASQKPKPSATRKYRSVMRGKKVDERKLVLGDPEAEARRRKEEDLRKKKHRKKQAAKNIQGIFSTHGKVPRAHDMALESFPFVDQTALFVLTYVFDLADRAIQIFATFYKEYSRSLALIAMVIVLAYDATLMGAVWCLFLLFGLTGKIPLMYSIIRSIIVYLYQFDFIPSDPVNVNGVSIMNLLGFDKNQSFTGSNIIGRLVILTFFANLAHDAMSDYQSSYARLARFIQKLNRTVATECSYELVVLAFLVSLSYTSHWLIGWLVTIFTIVFAVVLRREKILPSAVVGILLRVFFTFLLIGTHIVGMLGSNKVVSLSAWTRYFGFAHERAAIISMGFAIVGQFCIAYNRDLFRKRLGGLRAVRGVDTFSEWISAQDYSFDDANELMAFSRDIFDRVLPSFRDFVQTASGKKKNLSTVSGSFYATGKVSSDFGGGQYHETAENAGGFGGQRTLSKETIRRANRPMLLGQLDPPGQSEGFIRQTKLNNKMDEEPEEVMKNLNVRPPAINRGDEALSFNYTWDDYRTNTNQLIYGVSGVQQLNTNNNNGRAGSGKINNNNLRRTVSIANGPNQQQSLVFGIADGDAAANSKIIALVDTLKTDVIYVSDKGTDILGFLMGRVSLCGFILLAFSLTGLSFLHIAFVWIGGFAISFNERTNVTGHLYWFKVSLFIYMILPLFPLIANLPPVSDWAVANARFSRVLALVELQKAIQFDWPMVVVLFFVVIEKRFIESFARAEYLREAFAAQYRRRRRHARLRALNKAKMRVQWTKIYNLERHSEKMLAQIRNMAASGGLISAATTTATPGEGAAMAEAINSQARETDKNSSSRSKMSNLDDEDEVSRKFFSEFYHPPLSEDAGFKEKMTKRVFDAADNLSEFCVKNSYRPSETANDLKQYGRIKRTVFAILEWLQARTADFCSVSIFINALLSGSVVDCFLLLAWVTIATTVYPRPPLYWIEYGMVYVLVIIGIKLLIICITTLSQPSKDVMDVLSVFFVYVTPASIRLGTFADVSDLAWDFIVFASFVLRKELTLHNGVFLAIHEENEGAAELEKKLRKKQLKKEKEKQERAAYLAQCEKDKITPNPAMLEGPKKDIRQVSSSDDSSSSEDEDTFKNSIMKKEENQGKVDDGQQELAEGVRTIRLNTTVTMRRDNNNTQQSSPLNATSKNTNNNSNNKNNNNNLNSTVSIKVSEAEVAMEEEARKKKEEEEKKRRKQERKERRKKQSTYDQLSTSEKAKLFYEKYFICRKGIGVDSYLVSVCFIFVAFIIWILGYFQIVGGTGNLLSSLQSDLLPGTLVVVIAIFTLVLIADRAAYLLVNVLVKTAVHVILAVFGIFGYVVYRNSQRTPGFTPYLFFACCWCYLFVSASQIKSGFPRQRRHDPFTPYPDNSIRSTLYSVYMNVPFLWEMRTIIDWTFSVTALSIDEWFKVEDVIQIVFARRTDLSGRPERLGEKIAFKDKFIGLIKVLFIAALLLFPLMNFSTFNPSTAANSIVQMSVKIQFGQASPVYDSATFTATSIPGEYMAWLLHVFPGLAQYDILNAHKSVQLIELTPCSSELWTISPQGLRTLNTTLDEVIRTNGSFPLLVTFEVTRAKTSGAAPLVMTQQNAIDLDATAARQIKSALDSETAQSSAQVGKLLNPIMLNQPASLFPYDPIDQNCQLTLRVAEYNPEMNTNVRYWCLECPALFSMGNIPNSTFPEWDCLTTGINCDGKNNFESSAHDMNSHNRTSFYTVFISDDVAVSFGFLAGIGIIAFYTTFVLAVGSALRGMFAGTAHYAVFTEMAHPLHVNTLLQYLELARFARPPDLQTENRVYLQLIDLLRSPETLLRFTGRMLKLYKSNNAVRPEAQFTAALPDDGNQPDSDDEADHINPEQLHANWDAEFSEDPRMVTVKYGDIPIRLKPITHEDDPDKDKPAEE